MRGQFPRGVTKARKRQERGRRMQCVTCPSLRSFSCFRVSCVRDPSGSSLAELPVEAEGHARDAEADGHRVAGKGVGGVGVDFALQGLADLEWDVEPDLLAGQPPVPRLHGEGAVLRDAGVAAALHAHAGSGVLYAALSDGPDRVPALVHDLRRRLGPRRGHLIVEACPVEAKATMDVWGPLPSAGAARLMREMKAAYDPRGMLNPGRYVEGL